MPSPAELKEVFEYLVATFGPVGGLLATTVCILLYVNIRSYNEKRTLAEKNAELVDRMFAQGDRTAERLAASEAERITLSRHVEELTRRVRDQAPALPPPGQPT